MTAKSLKQARAALKSIFGYDDFRPGQSEIIGAVLDGEDVLAIMPTGSGKSMCYQLPAVVEGGLTVVVSPLIALMRDQVQQMQAVGVEAATLNSTNDEAEARHALQRMEAGELRLLFVSPERLAAGSLVSRLTRCGVRRLAIDEAHCVSQWGHDFRPEYRQLAAVREALGAVQTIALTATADRATRADVAAALFPKPPRIVVHSFDRPNLDLRFSPKERPRSQIEEVVTRNRGSSGIIYTSSRDKAERLADWLSGKGHHALPYHAGMDQQIRARNQDVFLQEDGVVIAATVAFGMGINKPDVRFVVHADMPPGIENYYQEIGRAGRDGLPAETLTLYGLDDMSLRRRQIDEKNIDEQRSKVEHRRLSAMIDLCESATCRRQALLAYFGEESGRCGKCDLCTGHAVMEDATEPARKLLSAVARTGERFGAGHLADILTGQTTDAVKRHGHDQIKTFGVGKDRSRRSWMTVVRQLFASRLLAEASDEHGGFRMTERGEDVLFGRENIQLRAVPDKPERRTRTERGGPRLGGLDEASAALFEELRALRLTIAREEGVAAYVVFPDRTLIDMAQMKPETPADMRLIQGVGAAKLARYGDVFLDAIARFGAS
ncbi:ATP-dependent DNA helicase RecQ [Agaricicola taiwanensis]|uniref:DNA helicase RecQ n=1 Tax=Agaricicola taiwanensis TaxID=591372 RepID=A0A8J2YAK8_9RHOB|nr:DNA helicase RecQ [Agaricicola taiwanensis]GGE29540.1 ATP-dependent DNA helicase RecQ [Agaricicola taiwanensis]